MKSVSLGYAHVPRVRNSSATNPRHRYHFRQEGGFFFTPIGLGLVEFLRDRTVDSIEAAIDMDMDKRSLPDMMEIDGRLDKHEELANVDVAGEL